MTDSLRSISSFVPALVIRKLTNDSAPIFEPVAERHSAAVLFADISDFTSLADRLSEKGLAGSEYLANLLNDCFQQVIEVVHQHGGEVTKFAGDALLALWSVDSDLARHSSIAHNALTNCCRLAAKCALEIQKANERFIGDDVKINLQIGLGAGDVYSVHLGGVLARWEFLLSGDPLVQMTRATALAKSGEVVLSSEVWDFVSHECVGERLDDGFFRLINIQSEVKVRPAEQPTLSPALKERLLSYLPAAVINRLEAGHDDWLSENRQVTVLFIKLPDYGTSIKHPYVRTIPQAQEVMRVLQESLYRYAGSINKLNVDDKGITLVAALGLPPLSHKDDASRAIHAALDMKEALEQLGRPSAIGITSGWVFCGPIGNELRREYTMVGQVVNLAARLMQAAENDMKQSGATGSIFCDEATYQTILYEKEAFYPLARHLQLDRVTGLAIKGREAPIKAYRPRVDKHPMYNSREVAEISTSFVGRETELSILNKRIAELHDSNGEEGSGTIIIEGEIGSGKSRLVDEIALSARRLKLDMLVGAAHPLHQHTAYYAWRPIFKKFFDLDPFIEDPRRMRSRVLSQLPPIRGEKGFPAFAIRLSPLLSAVLPVEFQENSHTLQMTAEERDRTTRFFLLRLLQRSVTVPGRRQNNPTLLIIENAQWLDDRSWELLLAVRAQVQALLTVLATRPLREQALGGPLSQACLRFIGSDEVEWITLEPLSRTELSQVVCQRLGVESIPSDLADLLVQKSGGNALFAEDLAREWLKQRHLKIEEGRCFVQSSISQIDVALAPLNVQKAITGRVERLAPTQQLILKVASVLSEPFYPDELYQIYPVEAERSELPDQLNSLLKIGLLNGESTNEGVKIRFKYDIIREMARSLLLESQYRRIRGSSTP